MKYEHFNRIHRSQRRVITRFFLSLSFSLFQCVEVSYVHCAVLPTGVHTPRGKYELNLWYVGL